MVTERTVPAEGAPEPGTAEAPEPTMAQMTAELVRERSKAEAKLTPVNVLAYEGKLLDVTQREELMAQIRADESCADIALMRTSNGDAYLFSTAFMSGSYARILLRVEDGNPYETIAGTVREESETYPRPTAIKLFTDRTFGMELEQAERLARELVQLPEYDDIKTIVASTGALYLYSERHLTRDWAYSLVEYEEVGRFQSP